jgi:hypothetical protein
VEAAQHGDEIWLVLVKFAKTNVCDTALMV